MSNLQAWETRFVVTGKPRKITHTPTDSGKNLSLAPAGVSVELQRVLEHPERYDEWYVAHIREIHNIDPRPCGVCADEGRPQGTCGTC